MPDTRPRVALNGKPIRLDQLAAEVGANLSSSATDLVVADEDASVTTAALQAALDQHVPVLTEVVGVGGRHPDAITLFGPEPRAANALALAGSSTGYVWPGDALSTSTVLWLMNRPPWKRLQFARLLVVWTPRDATAGVRLVQADSGPANITQIAEITDSTSATPIVSTANVTAALNGLIDAGAEKQIGYQVRRGASLTAHVHLVRLELLWLP